MTMPFAPSLLQAAGDEDCHTSTDLLFLVQQGLSDRVSAQGRGFKVRLTATCSACCKWSRVYCWRERFDYLGKHFFKLITQLLKLVLYACCNDPHGSKDVYQTQTVDEVSLPPTEYHLKHTFHLPLLDCINCCVTFNLGSA